MMRAIGRPYRHHLAGATPGSDLDIVALADAGLGNHSYFVDLGEGAALVVDPVRDPARYLALADRRRARVRWSVETHLHADFVSGSRELAVLGAGVAVPAAGGAAGPVTGLHDGDELDLGGLVLEAIATPGHTPEHIAYLLRDGATPLALFSGGALLPGGVARPDLLGPEQTETLARAAYRTLHERLLPLPEDLPVHPTHGAGSFCSAGGGPGGSTTIGAERLGNPLLAVRDADEFVDRLLGGLGSYPPYFLELREVNRAGPTVYGPAPPWLRELAPEEVERQVAAGAELVDVRDVGAFAAAHLPGSLSIPLRPQFAVWLGWLVARDRPLVFVTDGRTDRAELVRQCLGIGYERLAGELAGGIGAWRQTGRPTASLPLVAPEAVEARWQLVDVRQDSEWRQGHVAGAVHAELGSLPGPDGTLPDGPLLIHCGHGERASSAASVLARAGRRDVAVLLGGPEDLAEARGADLAAGS